MVQAIDKNVPLQLGTSKNFIFQNITFHSYLAIINKVLSMEKTITGREAIGMLILKKKKNYLISN